MERPAMEDLRRTGFLCTGVLQSRVYQSKSSPGHAQNSSDEVEAACGWDSL